MDMIIIIWLTLKQNKKTYSWKDLLDAGFPVLAIDYRCLKELSIETPFPKFADKLTAQNFLFDYR